MKKIFVASLLSAVVAMPAFAEESKMAVGAGWGFGNGGVLSLRGDYDISDMVGQSAVKARVGYDRYSLDSGAYTWSYNVFYAGAYKDFSKELNLDKIHPFAGLGYGFGSTSCSGDSALCASLPSPAVGGFYYIGGVKYDVTPQIEAEVAFERWAGLSLGANYKF